MLTTLALTALLCGQLTDDVPRSAKILEAEAAPSWVAPSLVTMAVLGGGPLAVTLGIAAHAAITGTTASVASLAISAAIGLVGATLVGAIMIGLALEESLLRADRLQPKRLAVWPWITSSLALILLSGVGLSVAAIVGRGLVFLASAAMTGLIAGPIVLVLLLGGATTAAVNGSRKPPPPPACSSESDAECRGVNLLTF